MEVRIMLSIVRIDLNNYSAESRRLIFIQLFMTCYVIKIAMSFVGGINIVLTYSV